MPPGDWACCASQRWAAQFVTLGRPRLFLPPKALLIAIAIADDPRAGLVRSSIDHTVPGWLARWYQHFSGPTRWVRVVRFGPGCPVSGHAASDATRAAWWGRTAVRL